MELIHFLSVHVTTVLTLQTSSTAWTVISSRTIWLSRACLSGWTRTCLSLDYLGGHIYHIVALRTVMLAFW